MTDWNNRVEAFALVDRAVRLQWADEHDGELSEIEECLVRALELDPENVGTLQEIAHFYDAVIPNPEKATRYAHQCRQQAMKIVSEMDSILADSE